MFAWIVKFYKVRRLRIAREEYAFWKARREYLEQHRTVSDFEKAFGKNFSDGSSDRIAEAAAKEAKYMERIEIYLRD